MKIVATIATVLATLLYSVTTYLLMYDPISRTTIQEDHIYNFFMWYTIPIILWVVYFIMNEIKKTNYKMPSFTNSNLKVNEHKYYIQENGSTSEPLNYKELSIKKINKNTYVWRKGIDWTKAGELRELNPLFEQNTPPPFAPPKPPPFGGSNTYYKPNYVMQIIAIIILFVILIAILIEIISYIV